MPRVVAPDSDQPSRPRVLIGGIGYRWMGDASFGLATVDRLSDCTLPDRFEAADLGYGAIYVAQDLLDAEKPKYDRLVLLAGIARNRSPGSLHTYRWQAGEVDAEELQERIREAGAGVIDLDHLLAIASYFQALPEQVEIVELEPVTTTGEALSAPAAARLADVVAWICQAEGAEDAFPADPAGRDGPPQNVANRGPAGMR